LLVGNFAERMFRGEALSSAGTGLLQGLMTSPDPEPLAVASVLLLCLALHGSLGGWVMVAARVAARQPVEEKTWLGGILENGRMLSFFLLSSMFILAWVLAGGGLGAWLVKGAFARLSLHALSAVATGFLGLLLLAGTFVGALYGTVTAIMGAFLAIAEPQTPFFKLYGRARALFGEGWDALGWIFVFACLWGALKFLLSYLLLPWPIAGAWMMGCYAFGDGLLMLFGVLLIAVIYDRRKA
ncbi:MAG: hypothetical protein ACM3YO_03940, partial [Bacteroidota bacterium]